ncbi:hypothetical protein M8312_04825 [Sphingomonas sp. KRR8]|uniref:hypothetical protein n=1 Tax=Sphingomonas sp. KRR8 TaxID=2942996 RepID=UPI002020273C|nr:hypothetical protein [Sphingomonas sp. KRR8]URD61839.1 hypothetical protein M8312_04825 [Sphingomonas sp. KRR8]
MTAYDPLRTSTLRGAAGCNAKALQLHGAMELGLTFAAVLGVTFLLSRTLGRRLTEISRATAVVCCALAVPGLLVLAAFIVEATGIDKGRMNDAWSFDLIFEVMAVLFLPFTFLVSLVSVPQDEL